MTILGANGRSQEAFLRKQPLKRVKVTTNNNIYPRCKDPKPSDMSVPPPPRPLGPRHSEDENASTGFAALALAHTGLAIPLLFQPHQTADFLLGTAALPHNVEHERLLGLLAAGLIGGAAASWALKGASERGELDAPLGESLQVGLMALAATAAGIHIYHSNDLTNNGLGAGLAVAAVTFGVPAARLLGSERGRKRFGSRIRSIFEGIPRMFDYRPGGFKLSSAIYAVLTPLFFGAGAAYIVAPGWTLGNFMGYVTKQRDSVFLWRNIGATAMTVLPAITSALKSKSDRNELDEAVPRTLNTGLLLASIGHLAVLGPMWYDNDAGRYTPLLLGAWTAAGAASILGLSSSATDRRI